MTPENNLTHNEWLLKLGLKSSDLTFSSPTYKLQMPFHDPKLLYEEHEGIIDEAAAQGYEYHFKCN